MYCQLCMKCGKLPRIGSGKWVQVGVAFLWQVKIRRHECSMSVRKMKIVNWSDPRSDRGWYDPGEKRCDKSLEVFVLFS